MANQDNLPVWAKILLGIPTDESGLPNHGEREELVNSNKRESAPAEPVAMEQSVTVFDPGKRDCSSSWKTALCSARGAKRIDEVATRFSVE